MEVELKNGRLYPSGEEPLPAEARALLTILSVSPVVNVSRDDQTGPARTCGELADRWERLPKLAPEEAAAFADDIESSRRNLQPPTTSWD